MKRYGFLFEELCSFRNLIKAAQKAQRGKRLKRTVCQFNLKLEQELLNIQDELRQKTYQIGRYKQFHIYDPKMRLISALPYKDRVVQHALCNVIEPIFDRTFIYDNYACRRNKGSHRAVDRFSRFCRANRFVLKCDIKNYFASIDHGMLSQFIAKKIKDADILWLVRLIIDSTPNPGIPIGNLASQLFANLYLNSLDRFIKEDVKCAYYIRYMDDLVVFNDDTDKLAMIKNQIADFITGLKLQMHPDKSRVFDAGNGVEFLGYMIYPSYRLIVWPNMARFKRRLNKLVRLFQKGRTTIEKITCSIQSWLGYAKHANSFNQRRRLFASVKITG